MKFKKVKTLNEAIAEMNSDKDQGVVGPVYADAVRQAKNVRDLIDKKFKERKVEMPNEDRFAHTGKIKGTPEQKKMKLAESLFTEWFDEDEDEEDDFYANNLVAKEDIYISRGDDDTVFDDDEMEKAGLLTYPQEIIIPKGTKLEYIGIGGYNTPAIIYSLPEYNNVEIKIYFDYWEDDFSNQVDILNGDELEEEIQPDQKYPVKSPISEATNMEKIKKALPTFKVADEKRPEIKIDPNAPSNMKKI